MAAQDPTPIPMPPFAWRIPPGSSPFDRCDGPSCPGLAEDALLVTTTKGRLCAPCWKRAGRSSAPPSTMPEEAAAVVEIRDRMLARGGTDRHMVRSGKAGV